MRRISVWILITLGVFVGTLLIVPFFININDYKPQLQSLAKESLDRDVRIEGKISLSLLPTPHIAVDNVYISNLKGGSPQDFLSVKHVRMSLQLLPLLKKKVMISSLTIDNPHIYLEKLKDGRANWIFTPKTPASSSQNFDVSFDNIQINNGDITFHTPSQNIELHDVSTHAKLDSLYGPYTLEGTLNAFDQKIEITAKASAMGESQDINFKIQADEGTLSFQGKVSQIPFTLKGNLSATADPKKLAAHFLQADKDSVPLSDTLRFACEVVAFENEVSLNQAKIEMGATHPTGDFKILLKDTMQFVGNIKDLPGQAHGNFTAAKTSHGIQGKIYAILPRAEDFFKGLKIDTKSLPTAVLGNIVFSTSYRVGETVHLEKLDLAIENAKLHGAIFWNPQDYTSALTFDLESPKIENVLRVFGFKTTALHGAGKLKASVQGDTTSFKATNLKGSLGTHLNFTGTIDVDRTGSKPNINASLSLNSLNMEMLTAAQETSPSFYPEGKLFFVAAHRKKENYGAHSRWSQEPLDFSFLNAFDGHFNLNAPHITYRDMIISNPKLLAQVKNGRLDMTSLVGSLFGGAFQATGHLTADHALKFHMNIKDANLKKLMTQGANVKIVDGTLSSTADLSSHGRSVHEMVRHLSGPLSISARNGIINGFDLHALSQQLATLQNPQSLLGLLNTKMGKGQTPFSSFKGNIHFKDGVGTIESMNLIAQSGQGNATGSINLPLYVLDVHAQFQLTEHPHLPPFHMRLSGPIDNPSRSLDTSALQKYMMENVFKTVIERLGKGKFRPEDILGSVIGPNAPQKPSSPPPSQGSDKPEQIVKNIFKGLF